MKPSTELFKLIKSLSKSEKRFFKLMSALQDGDKNYLKIFDFIDSRASYSEEDLKDFFRDETFIKHLPSEKNHLYKLILKSLRLFHGEESISSVLKQEIKNVEVLFNRALLKECEKFLVRAKILAQQHEEFYYWFELISWEKKLLENAYESGDFTKSIEKLIEEEEYVISRLRNLAEYQMIYSKIDLVFRSGGFTRTENEIKVVDDIADYHLIKGQNTALSIRASSMCYYIKGLCAASKRDYNQSFIFFNKTREILDKNEFIKIDLGQRYVMTLSHLLRCYIENKNFDKASQLIHDLRSLEGLKGFTSTEISLKIFTRSSVLELMLFHSIGEFKKSVLLLPEIERKQKIFGDKVSKEQEVLLTYYKAYNCFGSGDYKKALFYLNNILNDNEQKLRQDIYSFSRIFNLILHYELGNIDLLDYLIKSAGRYFSKNDRLNTIELTFIKYFRKLSRAIENSERLLIFEMLKQELDELFLDEKQKVVLEYFNIGAWLTSKIYKITFSEAIKSELELNSTA
jgi:hypothetical protein